MGAAPTVLVGRDKELARLEEAIRDVAAGLGGVLWIEGEPGIGKSALLRECLIGAARHGCDTFAAAADELGQQLPLQAMLECLDIGYRPADPERAHIAAVLRGRGPAGLVAADPVLTATELLIGLVERVCERVPAVLIVDDLQWADEASLLLWGRLFRLVEQLPLLLVTAARPVPLRAVVATLRRGVSAREGAVIRLDPLNADDAGELVGRFLGARAGPVLRGVAERAGGNPLYLRELVDALQREDRLRPQARGVVDLAAAAGPSVPVSLMAAVGVRLGFLSEPTRETLQMAALLGPRFAVTDLATLTDQPAARLSEAVREAVAAEVLVDSGDRLRFRHPLIHQVLYEEVPTSLRSALHRQAAEQLPRAGAPVDKVAEQLLATPEHTDEWMLDWLVETAGVLAQRAPAIAADLLGRALARTVSGDDRRREALQTSQVNVMWLLGRYDEVERLGRQALAIARDPERTGQIAWTLAYTFVRGSRYDDALAVTADASTDPRLSATWSARLNAMRAMVLAFKGWYADADTAGQAAVAEAERVGDRTAVGYALSAVSLVRSHYLDADGALALIERALDLIGDHPEATDLRLMLLGNRMTRLQCQDRVVEADAALSEMLALGEQMAAPPRLARLRLQAAEQYYETGRWDDSRVELERAESEAAVDQPSFPVRLCWHGLAALLAAHRDDRDEVDRHVRAAAELDITPGEARYFSDWLWGAQAPRAERDGHPDRALAALAPILAPENAEDFGLTRWMWLPEGVRLALAVGDRETAGRAAEACRDEAAQRPTQGTLAASERCDGLVAGDPTLLLAAAGHYRECRRLLDQGLCLEDAAALLAQRDDAVAARAAFNQAVEIYSGLGAVWDVLRAENRLRSLGVRRSSRALRRRPSAGWAALTPSEVRIARLVAEGLSNSAIGAELFLSPRTVQTHVSHILIKLNARSRVEIARETSRHT